MVEKIIFENLTSGEVKTFELFSEDDSKNVNEYEQFLKNNKTSYKKTYLYKNGELEIFTHKYNGHYYNIDKYDLFDEESDDRIECEQMLLNEKKY